MMADLKLPLHAPRDTRWADGLRGLAAIFVVSSHLVLGYAEWLTAPARTKHTPAQFYNWPFIRVFAEGVPWVSIFLILTGFVNALKPIKQARAGRADSALATLASSCLRRTSRLVLPCTVATMISWIICELGGYKTGKMMESKWMNNTSPEQSKTFWGALHKVLRASYDTWAWYKNSLDQNQWTMLWFLRGSLVLYVALLALVRATPRWRMITFVGLFLYGWKACDTMIIMPIFSGALLAELSMEPLVTKFSTSKNIIIRLIPFSIFLLGWYFMSYPKYYPEWQPWSNTLWHTGMFLFPKGAEVLSFWSCIGVILVTFAIIMSARLQQIFSHPVLLWLGAQSFPIYLIHGPLLRSFLNWILYAFVSPIWYEERDDKGKQTRIFSRYPIPPTWKFLIALPIFYAMLFFLAHLWTLKIESRCAAVTKYLEDTMCGFREEPVFTENMLKHEDEPTSPVSATGSEMTSGSLLPT